MASDRVIGVILLVISVLGTLVYGWLIFVYNPLLILEITAFIAVAIVLGIIAWIGYTMATTPPPEPLDVGETSETSTTPTAPEEAEAEKPESKRKTASRKKTKK